jgi:hypothetical protein
MRELRSDPRIIAGSVKAHQQAISFRCANDLRGQAGKVDAGSPRDSKLSPAQADPQQEVLLAPKDWTDAEKKALSKLAHVASDRRRPAAGSDFYAGPRLTELSFDTTLRPADLNNGLFPTERPSLGIRTSRSLARFLVAACVGVAATLAWQSYGDTAKQMIANSAPQLSWLVLPPPATDPPSGRESGFEQLSPPAIQAPAPREASAQGEVVASIIGNGRVDRPHRSFS